MSINVSNFAHHILNFNHSMSNQCWRIIKKFFTILQVIQQIKGHLIQGSFCVCTQPVRDVTTVTSSLIGWAHTQNDPFWYACQRSLIFNMYCTLFMLSESNGIGYLICIQKVIKLYACRRSLTFNMYLIQVVWKVLNYWSSNINAEVINVICIHTKGH